MDIQGEAEGVTAALRVRMATGRRTVPRKEIDTALWVVMLMMASSLKLPLVGWTGAASSLTQPVDACMGRLRVTPLRQTVCRSSCHCGEHQGHDGGAEGFESVLRANVISWPRMVAASFGYPAAQ